MLVRSLVRSHRSLVRSLAHFAHSLARGTVNDWMVILSVFFSIFDHSEYGIKDAGDEGDERKVEECRPSSNRILDVAAG